MSTVNPFNLLKGREELREGRMDKPGVVRGDIVEGGTVALDRMLAVT